MSYGGHEAYLEIDPQCRIVSAVSGFESKIRREVGRPKYPQDGNRVVIVGSDEVVSAVQRFTESTATQPDRQLVLAFVKDAFDNHTLDLRDLFLIYNLVVCSEVLSCDMTGQLWHY